MDADNNNVSYLEFKFGHEIYIFKILEVPKLVKLLLNEDKTLDVDKLQIPDR